MLSAIAWFVFRLSTTDMAFVWSTTLDIEPQTMAVITNSLALPWAHLAPQATIDLDTIGKRDISVRITARCRQTYMQRNSGAGGRLCSPP